MSQEGDMKTSLGIWALGPMVTRFVPGGYKPQRLGETTAERGSPDASHLIPDLVAL